MRIFAQVFSINSAGWKAMNLRECSNIWANNIIVQEVVLRAFLLSSLFYNKISDKDENLVRDFSPSQGLLQSAIDFTGKNSQYHNYLAVLAILVIPELIWGRCTYMIFVKFSENVYMGISFEKMQKKTGGQHVG